jgi:HlyD family secretion protein
MNKILLVIAIIILAGAGYWFYGRTETVVEEPYRFVEVERGDIEQTVASTGTLEPVLTVQVGTQVSGRVAAIYADYNDQVRQGQLIARIDTTLLVTAIREAQINLERSVAQLRQAEREFARISELYEKQISTQVEFNNAQYAVETANAAVKSAEINLERAQQNLGYANIYAPVSGTIIERTVTEGQTVSASTSAPQLFLIANDLRQMQILASVDESDIGMIEVGQEVRFTTQAHQGETFTGTVQQIRLQPSTANNVVNYTVVIGVNNDRDLLMPGMTATVDFLIQRKENVLKVPNAALRFRPTAEQLAAFQAGRPDSMRIRVQGPPAGQNGQGQAAGTQQGQTAGGQQGQGQRLAQGPGGGLGAGAFGGNRVVAGQQGGGMGQIWYLDESGNLAMRLVRTGITDGQTTEIIAEDLEPGFQVIAGAAAAGAAGQAAASPFQQRPQGFGPGGGVMIVR